MTNTKVSSAFYPSGVNKSIRLLVAGSG